MVAWIVEPKRKKKPILPPFGVKVKLPVEFINYRAYEETRNGIAAEIEKESSYARRQKLFKIRKQITKILEDL